MGFKGIKKSLLKMFGQTVTLKEYKGLEGKYNSLKFEFRHYRDKAELRERRLRKENEEIRNSLRISNEMFNIMYPYIITATAMKSNDVVKLKELQDERNKILF